MKEYPEEKVVVTEEGIKKYIEGILENNPFFKDGKIAPPLYATAISVPFTGKVLFDDEINQGVNPLRVVHGEQDSIILKLLVPGEYRIKVRFLEREEKEAGTIFKIMAEQFDVKGEKYGETYHNYFVRKERKGEKKSGAGAEACEVPGKKLYSKSIEIPKDLPIKYAEGSGDRFPIHTDENFAKSMGFPTIILHGMCTMALCVKTFVDHIGDPTKIKRVSTRFSKVVFPKDVLTFSAYETQKQGKYGKKVVEIYATNQNGEDVLKNTFIEYD